MKIQTQFKITINPYWTAHKQVLEELFYNKRPLGKVSFKKFFENEAKKWADEACMYLRGIMLERMPPDQWTWRLWDCVRIVKPQWTGPRKSSFWIGIFDLKRARRLKMHRPRRGLQYYWEVLEVGCPPFRMSKAQMYVLKRLKEEGKLKRRPTKWTKRLRGIIKKGEPIHVGLKPRRFLRDSTKKFETIISRNIGYILPRYIKYLTT